MNAAQQLVGRRMQVVGLTGRKAKYNGKVGRIEAYDESTDCFKVNVACRESLLKLASHQMLEVSAATSAVIEGCDAGVRSQLMDPCEYSPPTAHSQLTMIELKLLARTDGPFFHLFVPTDTAARAFGMAALRAQPTNPPRHHASSSAAADVGTAASDGTATTDGLRCRFDVWTDAAFLNEEIASAAPSSSPAAGAALCSCAAATSAASASTTAADTSERWCVGIECISDDGSRFCLYDGDDIFGRRTGVPRRELGLIVYGELEPTAGHQPPHAAASPSSAIFSWSHARRGAARRGSRDGGGRDGGGREASGASASEVRGGGGGGGRGGGGGGGGGGEEEEEEEEEEEAQ